MREPSTLYALLDDAAATGDLDKLDRVEERARNKVSATMRNLRRPQQLPVLWAHVADAAHWRRKAIQHRLAGRIENALRSERYSEEALARLAEFGTRFVHDDEHDDAIEDEALNACVDPDGDEEGY